MFKKIIFTFLSVMMISSSSFAALGGNWIGFGRWTFKGEGEGVICNPMTLNMSETADTFSMNESYFDCEFVSMELLPLTWKKLDNKLYDEENKEVGTYDGTTLFAELPQPNPTTRIHVSMKREANHIDYQEVWFNQYEKIYVITARFFTSQ